MASSAINSTVSSACETLSSRPDLVLPYQARAAIGSAILLGSSKLWCATPVKAASNDWIGGKGYGGRYE